VNDGMMKSALVLAAAGTMLLAASACKRGVEKEIPTPVPTEAAAVMPPQTGGAMPGGMPPGMGGEQEGVLAKPAQPRQVVVPAAVTQKWKGVKLVVKEKTQGGFTKEYDVATQSEVAVAGTALRIKVGDLLPEFSMDNAAITSRSADPNMPAVWVEITEGKEKVFQGWIFSKMPEVHAFTHEKYQVVFAGLVPR
jgi:hypothetical protein